jgi:hypothetical protein
VPRRDDERPGEDVARVGDDAQELALALDRGRLDLLERPHPACGELAGERPGDGGQVDDAGVQVDPPRSASRNGKRACSSPRSSSWVRRPTSWRIRWLRSA